MKSTLIGKLRIWFQFQPVSWDLFIQSLNLQRQQNNKKSNHLILQDLSSSWNLQYFFFFKSVESVDWKSCTFILMSWWLWAAMIRLCSCRSSIMNLPVFKKEQGVKEIKFMMEQSSLYILQLLFKPYFC